MEPKTEYSIIHGVSWRSQKSVIQIGEIIMM